MFFKKKKKVEKIVLDRSRWAYARLVRCNKTKGQYCAVGAYLTQLGVSPEKLSKAGAGSGDTNIKSFYKDIPSEGRWLFYRDGGLFDIFRKDIFRNKYHSTTPDGGAIMTASDYKEEGVVKRLFKKHDVEVEFVGEYDV